MSSERGRPTVKRMSRLTRKIWGRHWLMLALTVALCVLVLKFVDLKPQVGQNFFFSSDDPSFQEDAQIDRMFPSGSQLIVTNFLAPTNFIPTLPISLLVLVAVVNGIAAAPFLIVVMIISRNRPLMGENRNGDLAAILGWATVALMTAAAVAVLVTLTGA